MNKYSKTKILFCLLIAGGFSICPIFSFGATNDVIINEIAWMGMIENWRHEWIELYNNTDQNISLDGWKMELYRDDLDFTIELSGNIEDYFLIVSSDIIFANYDFNYSNLGGKFNNSGQRIVLKNNQGVIVDEIDCFSSGEGWLAGDNDTKQTMEKIDKGWQTSQEAGGTPKAQNSSGSQETPPEDDEEQPEEESAEESTIDETTIPIPVNQPPIADAGLDITALVNQEIIFDGSLSSDPDNDILTFFWNFGDGATDIEEIPKHTYLYPGQYIVALLVSDDEFSDLDIITVNIYNQSIIISEFMPDPEGTDTEDEWIELYNQSDQIANLTNWQIDDQEDGSSPFTFPSNSLIGPKQFLVLRRPITKIALNNDNDQVRLLYPDGSLATEVSYLAEKKQGFSIAFDGYDYFWTKIPTPGSANIISLTDLNYKDENISSNNPQPIIEQSQEAPEILANINFNQSQDFPTLNPVPDSINSQIQDPPQLNQPVNQIELDDILSQQSVSLSKSIQTNKKANLILTLSIVISGSLIASWFLIQFRKRRML